MLIIKEEYSNKEEREMIINKHRDKYLIEEQNITEGNFLVFMDVRPVEIEIEELKLQNDMLLIGLADTYETQQNNSDMLLSAVAEVYEIILGGVE